MEEITVDRLAEKLKAGGLRVIDVRNPDEYRQGHIPSAELITMATIPLRISELPRDEDIYIVCESGGRSFQVCSFLDRQGYRAVNVQGGTGVWRMAGLPIKQGMEA